METKRKSGAPRTTTEEEDVEIVNEIKTNPKQTAVAIKQALGLNCHRITIGRRLSQAGYHHHIPAIKPDLKVCHKEERMRFALEYIIKDNEFWKNVIYSDEKKILHF